MLWLNLRQLIPRSLARREACAAISGAATRGYHEACDDLSRALDVLIDEPGLNKGQRVGLERAQMLVSIRRGART